MGSGTPHGQFFPTAAGVCPDRERRPRPPATCGGSNLVRCSGRTVRLPGAAASKDGGLEAVKSAGMEWVLREALLALVRAGARFEAGKLVERLDEHPNPKPPKRSSSTG